MEKAAVAKENERSLSRMH